MVRIFRKKNIRNCVQLLFIYLCVISTILMPNNQEFFLRGNKYFEEKNYEKALDAYSMIDQKGSAVLYNMANCLFNLEKYTEALVYLLKAEKGSSGKELNNILRNQELVLKKLGKKKELSWWQQNKNFMAIQLSYGSGFLLQLLILFCWWILFWILYKKKKRLQSILLSIFGCCAIIVANIGTTYFQEKEKSKGLVIKAGAQIFAGPNKNFQVISPIEYAAYVSIKEVRPGWYKIKHDCGIGWVEEDIIQVI